jgi:hypothetical protein
MKKIDVLKNISPIVFFTILSASDISVGDILVYKCIVDNVPTYQNIPCQAPLNTDQDQRRVLHIRSNRDVIQSSGSVPPQQTNSATYTNPDPIGYTQAYGRPKSPNPTPEAPAFVPGTQQNNIRDVYRRLGLYPPPEGNTTKPRRRFQGKELKFKDIQPRQLEFTTAQPRELQYKELQFRQVKPKQVQSRGIRGKSVQPKGV